MSGICVELAGIPGKQGVTAEWRFDASVGDSGFNYTLYRKGETNPVFAAGGQDGVLITVEGWPPGSTYQAHVATYARPDTLGWGPGILLYSLLANHSQAIVGVTNLPIENMVETVYGHELNVNGLVQKWEYDKKRPFSVISMEAYVLPGQTPMEQSTYPEGWKIGDLTTGKKSDENNIPLEIEAHYYQPRRNASLSPSAIYSRNNTLLLHTLRLNVDSIADGSSTGYLPQLGRGLFVHDSRILITNSSNGQYWLKADEPWPMTAVDILAKRAEAIRRSELEGHVKRRPTTLVLGLMIIFAITLTVVVYKTNKTNKTK